MLGKRLRLDSLSENDLDEFDEMIAHENKRPRGGASGTSSNKYSAKVCFEREFSDPTLDYPRLHPTRRLSGTSRTFQM